MNYELLQLIMVIGSGMSTAGVLMNRRLFYLAVLTGALSACTAGPSKQADGGFEYVKAKEIKPLETPENLSAIQLADQYNIPEVQSSGQVGENIDIRSPSLVLPIASQTRVEPTEKKATVWFDQVLDDKPLKPFIVAAIKEQLSTDEVELIVIDEEKGKYASGWFHEEAESGWLFTETDSIENVKFTYQIDVKPHGRSASLVVAVDGFMRTDKFGSTDKITGIDKQRAEMKMLNNIIAQVDYKYRLYNHENRLLRSNQKLVTVGENDNQEPTFVVEMNIDNLWANMPTFFEDHGFELKDLNDAKRIYYVDFVQPDVGLWDRIWGDDIAVIELEDSSYQFKLTENEEQTFVTIYREDGSPLEQDIVERIFPVIEPGLSFRNIF